MVSVIMPAYNAEDNIKYAVESVIKQTYQNWELLIIDDFSTDNTLAYIEKLSEVDSRIRVFQLKKNSGAAFARNVGLENANGEYIAFLDSDDLWDRNKLSIQLDFMKKNNFAFTATSYDVLSNNKEISNYKKVPPNKSDYNKMLFLSCPIGNSTVIYKRSKKLQDIRVPNIKKRNDFALWLQLLKKTEYCYGLDMCLTTYRSHKNSLSSNKFKLAKYHWRLYRKVEGLGYVKSLVAIILWPIVKIGKYGYKKK